MQQTRHIRSFLFGQNLADGLRVSLEIIAPAFLFSMAGDLQTGMTISLGALCVSISDIPGPVEHKRKGMLYCNLFVFLMAVLTGFMNHNLITLGVLILVASFFFTMFSMYGNRAASVGTAALLIMVLRMSAVIESGQLFHDAFLILGGGTWYMAVALIFYKLAPYRAIQRALGECLHETASYLRIKAQMYEATVDREEVFKNLIDSQVRISEKQDEIRELLFINRSIVKEPTKYGRILVLTFVDVVDLFEQAMASSFQYDTLQKKYGDTSILQEVYEIIIAQAQELDIIGDAIHNNGDYASTFYQLPDLDKLKIKIDALPGLESKMALKKVLVNLRRLTAMIKNLSQYFDENLIEKKKLKNVKEYSRFVSHQRISVTTFFLNFTLESSVFRHALRMMLTCGAGFIIAKLISTGHYSYWIIMTILIILKPGYGLTRQRNTERLAGTAGGALLGILLIAFVDHQTTLFIILFFCMVGTYTFIRSNYILMVIFLTPYVLILFNFLGLTVLDIAGERLADTAIASALAFLGSYFLFPSWESKNLKKYMAKVISANMDYLSILGRMIGRETVTQVSYKLIRKELFVSTANLSAALHRMQSEPKSKQKNKEQIHEFVVLNHILSSNIASINADELIIDNVIDKRLLARISNSKNILQKTFANLEATLADKNTANLYATSLSAGETETHLSSQLLFIEKISKDILKVTQSIVG